MESAEASSSDLASQIASFRHFNRMYTRYIGTLDEGLLHTDYTLAEARVLYELATRTAPKATEIAEALAVDPGYLSRLLGKFERDGLLLKKISDEDGRSAELTLTAHGSSAFKKLNALSNEQARTTLQTLPPAARMELIRCVRSIEALLMNVDRGRPSFVLRPIALGIWAGSSTGKP